MTKLKYLIDKEFLNHIDKFLVQLNIHLKLKLFLMNFDEYNYVQLRLNIQLSIMNNIFFYKDILILHKAINQSMIMVEFH